MDQIAEYRAFQQQRFDARQLKLEQEQDCAAAQDCRIATAQESSALPCSSNRELSCPGTPREYRERQQQRFAAERLRRHQEQDGASAPASDSTSTEASMTGVAPLDIAQPPAATDELNSRFASARECSSNSSPSAPRLRGSASLRAISAARATRMADAASLPGAAWPGHSQNLNSNISQSTSTKPPVLPTRPSTPLGIGTPRLRWSSSRSFSGFPPRPPTPCSLQGDCQGYHPCVSAQLQPLLIEQTFRSCAQAMGSSHQRTSSLGVCF